MLTVGTVAAVTLLTLASMHSNGILATVVTALKVALVAGIGIAAFVFSDGSWAHYAASGAAGTCQGVSASARLGINGFGAAVVGALWSYNGWADISFVAEEVRAPGWTLPRALIGGSALIIGLYLLINAGYFYSLEPLAVANVPEATSVASVVMVRTLGAGGVSLLTVGVMLSTFGALHAIQSCRSPWPLQTKCEPDRKLPRVAAPHDNGAVFRSRSRAGKTCPRFISRDIAGKISGLEVTPDPTQAAPSFARCSPPHPGEVLQASRRRQFSAQPRGGLRALSSRGAFEIAPTDAVVLRLGSAHRDPQSGTIVRRRCAFALILRISFRAGGLKFWRVIS